MELMRQTDYRGPSVLLLGMILISGAEAEGEQKVPLGMVEVRVAVELSCPSCAQGLERRLRRLDHIGRVQIQSDEGRVVLEPEPGHDLDLEEIRRVIRNAGFLPTTVWLRAVGRVTWVHSVPGMALSGDGVVRLAPGGLTDRLVAEAGDRIVQVMGHVSPDDHGQAGLLHVEAFELP